MTNREAHEEAAGMGLDDMFFTFNGIDPDAEYSESCEESYPCQCGGNITKNADDRWTCDKCDLDVKDEWL